MGHPVLRKGDLGDCREACWCGRAKGCVVQETPSRFPEDISFPAVASPETKWIRSSWQLNIYSSYRDLSETFKAAVIVTGFLKKSVKQDNPMRSLNVYFYFFYRECFPGRLKVFWMLLCMQTL